MSDLELLNLFFLVFIYGGLREYFRIEKGSYKWLQKLALSQKMFHILGRGVFIFVALMFYQMQFKELTLSTEPWKKIYLYISIIFAEELGSYVFSKLTIKSKEYALASMMPGFIILVTFFSFNYRSCSSK